MFVGNTTGFALTTAAPASNATVGAAVVPESGVYSARVVIQITGTPETQLTNLRMRNNTANVMAQVPSVPGTVVLEIDHLQCVAGTNVDLQAILAATAGSVYTITILLTRIA